MEERTREKLSGRVWCQRDVRVPLACLVLYRVQWPSGGLGRYTTHAKFPVAPREVGLETFFMVARTGFLEGIQCTRVTSTQARLGFNNSQLTVDPLSSGFVSTLFLILNGAAFATMFWATAAVRVL